MTKIISLELSKKLTEAGLLDNIETEYCYKDGIVYHWETYRRDVASLDEFKKELKALTLEEAIEFIGKQMCQMQLLYPNAGKWLLQTVYNDNFESKTLIGVFEQFIEYLLTNKLLGNNFGEKLKNK